MLRQLAMLDMSLKVLVDCRVECIASDLLNLVVFNEVAAKADARK